MTYTNNNAPSLSSQIVQQLVTSGGISLQALHAVTYQLPYWKEQPELEVREATGAAIEALKRANVVKTNSHAIYIYDGLMYMFAEPELM